MNAVAKRETENLQTADRASFLLPAVNIYETEEGYQLEADMPGATRTASKSISITTNSPCSDDAPGRPPKPSTIGSREKATSDGCSNSIPRSTPTRSRRGSRTECSA